MLKSFFLILMCGVVLSGAEMSSNGKLAFAPGLISPTKFRNYSGATTTAQIENDAVTITVRRSTANSSNFACTITDIPKREYLYFSADTVANRGSAGHLMIRLVKDGKEIMRRESPRASRQARNIGLDFYTGDADQVILQYRIPQDESMIGVCSTFSNLQLGRGFYVSPESAGKPRLELVPGFENCSIYLNHCRSEKSSDFTSSVRYRRQGDEQWLTGQELVYHPEQRNGRSSLFKLAEGGVYDVELTVTEAGKTEKLTGKFRTCSSEFPIAKTIELNSGNFKEQLVITESGSPDGYIRYTAGQVLQAGETAHQAILVDGAEYVILDGLTVRGGRRFGIVLAGAHNVVIRNCDIADFGELGIPDLRRGYKYMQGAEALRDISGIRIQDSGKLLIERNYIHDSKAKSCPWFYSHADGANGISIRSTGGLTIRYNDIVGSDEYRWTDGITGYGNGDPTGGVYRDAEVYGNYLAFGNDDGVEFDGGQMNCRFYWNKVEGMLCGISTAPCLLGPSYIFENLFCNPGDEFGIANFALKNTISWSKGRGRLHFFNNTVTGNWRALSDYGGKNEPKEIDYSEILKAVTRNNLFYLSTGDSFFSPGTLKLRNDFDYDLFNPSSIDFLTEAGLEQHALSAKPEFIGENRADYRLCPSSPGIAAGVPVPGLYQAKPDIGAFLADGPRSLPHRPVGFQPAANQLDFAWEGAVTDKFTVTVDPGYRGEFRIRQNRTTEFFTVSPLTGTFTGEPLEFTVTLNPEKMPDARVYSGAFMISTPEGYSRPVSIQADYRQNPEALARNREEVIFGKVAGNGEGGYICEFELKEAGEFFLFGFVDGATGHVDLKRPGKNAKFERTGVMSVKGGLQPRWSSFRSGSSVFATLLPTRYPAGKYRFEVKSIPENDCKLEAIALALKPESLLASPFMR